MEKIVETIAKSNNLFKDNYQIEKVDIGFTNTIYKVNDRYIIKICTNINNEESFKKEIKFYESNKNNEFIPKLYYKDTTKKIIPYYYEIIEKIEGESLYSVWHNLKEKDRENIIEQLCTIMKRLHLNKGDNYDWHKYLNNKFNNIWSKIRIVDIFTKEEKKLIEQAQIKFKKYLDTNEVVLVHNDLHFDNIFIDNGKIKIIDFERSMYAPKDFELDIIFRMIDKPWKFANEKDEANVNKNDYIKIREYIKKYYTEIIDTPYLLERLAIYNLIYYLNQIYMYPNNEELKNDILLSAKYILNI